MSRDNLQKVRETADILQRVAKHFGETDSRHDSLTHVPGGTQMVHGNRPGIRTQSTTLSALDLMPSGFGDASAIEQADYFVQAAGYSSPVVQVGDKFWLAPPHALMLPEHGAGENVTVDQVQEKANTHIGAGLSPMDALHLTDSPDSEEGKRELEAAAEHRKNDYQGPTTPALDAKYGDQLRRDHPKQEPKVYSPQLTPDVQHRILSEVLKEKEKKRRLGLPLQKMQTIALIGNLLQNFDPSGAGNSAFVSALMDLVSIGGPGGQRQGSTASGTTGTGPAAGSGASTQEAAATASDNATHNENAQREGAAQQEQARQERKTHRLKVKQQRAKRLGRRL